MPRSSTTLKDLIDAGFLGVGEELTCVPPRHIGGTRKAHLQADGSIKDDSGSGFRSPFAWAKDVKRRNSNGWDNVTARGEPLAILRQKFASGEKPTGEPPSPGSDPVPVDDSEGDVSGKLRERIMNLAPSDFEALVGEYFRAKGLGDVTVTGRTNDGGIDGHCEIPFISVKVAFQAKRYAASNSVGIEPVQRLSGSMTGRFDRGVLVTTSSYTPAAKGCVQERKAPIALIDGDDLVEEMIRLGQGVKAIPVVRHDVDEDFFADLENK